jgi:hypothetical protein
MSGNFSDSQSRARARRRGIIAIVSLTVAILYALLYWANENGYLPF